MDDEEEDEVQLTANTIDEVDEVVDIEAES